MTDADPKPWRGAHVKGVLLVMAATIGIVLPIDFLLAVDGYLVFLRPWELLPVWAWAWLYYACFGLVIGALAALAATALAVLLRRDSAPLVLGVARWTALSTVAVAVIRAAKLWVGLHNVAVDEWLGRNQMGVGALVLLACGVAVWRNVAELRILQRVLGFCAFCGFVVVLVAPVVCTFHREALVPQGTARPDARPAADHPDIILVTADAFAANHASFMGYSRPTTPNLERLANGADVFERYYANSNFTTASVNSILDGVRPWTHRANQFLAVVSTAIADAGLVGRLKRAGYATDAVWTNSLAAPFLNRSDRSLDVSAFARTHYSGPMISSVMATRFSHFTPVTELGAFITTVKVVDRLMIASGAWTPTDQNALEPAFDRARALIRDRDPSRPLFLWVHVMRPHSPYAAPPPFLGRFNPGPLMRTRYDSSPINEFFSSRLDDERVSQFAGRYDEGLAYFDSSIGEFIEWLKGHGVFEKTLLIVSSDHGESFSHRYGTHAGPMLHEDVIHVPLLIKEPGQAAGRRVGVLSEQIDLMPTILDLAGVAVEGPVEGRSLRPAIQGQRMDGPVFSMNFEQNSRFKGFNVGSIAMIEGRWKYVRYLGHLRGPLIPPLADAVYDLQSDPGETSNLVSVQAAVAARMRNAIEEQLRRHDQPPE